MKRRVRGRDINGSAESQTKALRAEIEKTAPIGLAARRGEVGDFLLLKKLPLRATWVPSRAWTAFKKKLHSANSDLLPLEWLIREFYAVLRNASYQNDGDAVEIERRRRAVEVLPKRRWRERNTPQLAALALVADRIGEPAARHCALNLEVGRYEFADPMRVRDQRGRFRGASKLQASLRLGDFLPQKGKPERSNVAPGSGRPGALETAQDELLRFLIGVGLSRRAAANVARDCLALFVGVHVGERTILSRKVRLRRSR